MLSSILLTAGNGEVNTWLQAWHHQWNFGVLDEEWVHTTPGVCARYTGHIRNAPVLAWAHLGTGRSTWQDDTRGWDVPENRNIGIEVSPAEGSTAQVKGTSTWGMGNKQEGL